MKAVPLQSCFGTAFSFDVVLFDPDPCLRYRMQATLRPFINRLPDVHEPETKEAFCEFGQTGALLAGKTPKFYRDCCC
jgi:hypothetical protein